MSDLLVPEAGGDVGARPAPSVRVRHRGRRWAAPIAGTACAAVTYSVIDRGVLGPWAAVGVLVLLLVGTPTARRLSPRIAVNGSLFMAVTSVLWWTTWLSQANRTGLLLAVVAGALVWFVTGAASPRRAMLRLVPAAGRSDVVLIPAAGAAAWSMSGWLFASSPRQALVTMLPGADNWVHFDIATTMRMHGGRLSAVDLPSDGGLWRNGTYPAGFHSLVASLSELSTPKVPSGPESLVAYAHGVGMLVVLGTLVLVGSLLALIGERGRLEVTAPAGALVCSAFLWEPGQKLFADGFAGFWLGCLAAAAALLLSVASRTQVGRTGPAAVVALLAVVVLCWPPLLMLGGPALLFVALASLRRRSWRSVPLSRRHALLVGAVAVLALGAAAYVGVVPKVGLRLLLTAQGGITGTSPAATFVLLVVAATVCLALPRWVAATGRASDSDLQKARDVRLLGMIPVSAMLTIALLLWAEFAVNGGTAYYFLKYLIGVKLVMAAVAVGAIAVSITLLTRDRRATPWRWALSLVGLVLATQAFSPFPGGAIGLRAHPGGTAGLAPPYDVEAVASGVLSAAGSSTPGQSFDREYVAMGSGRASQAFYPDAWFHALFASTTTVTSARLDALRQPVSGPREAVPVIESMLEAAPDLQVVVAPQWVDEVRAGLGSTALASRVITWDAAG